MVVIIAVLLFLVLIWLILVIKDLILRLIKGKNSEVANSSKKRTMKNSSWCQNFILRFFYEFFLEFCICIFLQLSVKDFSDFSPTLQFWLSVVVIVAIFALFAFIMSLFFCGGPWVSKFYKKGSSSGSVWRVRPRNPDFDKVKYLKEHPVPPVKPWGRILINIDFDKLLRCGGKDNSGIRGMKDFARPN